MRVAPEMVKVCGVTVTLAALFEMISVAVAVRVVAPATFVVAVIVTVPVSTAVARPEASTVAMAGLLDDQVSPDA